MANWYVIRGTKELGPFQDAQLRHFAATGKLKTEDIVRREDVSTGRKASDIKGLFPAPELELSMDLDTPPPIPDRPQEVPVAINQPTLMDRAKQSATNMAEYAKKQTKLKSLEFSEIPALLTKIGTTVFAERLHQDVFADLYAEIDGIDAQVAELRIPLPTSATDTVADRMKRTGTAAVNATKAEACLNNRKKRIQRLGEKFEQAHLVDETNPLQPMILKLRELFLQRDQLKGEIAGIDFKTNIVDGSKQFARETLEGARAGTAWWQKPWFLVASMFFCFPVALGIIWTNRTWEKNRKIRWTAGFVCGFILFATAGRSQKRSQTHDVEPTLIRGDSNGELKLTASFLPSKTGWVWIYSDKTLANGKTDFEYKTTIKAQTAERLVAESTKVSSGPSTSFTNEMRISESSTTVQRGTVPKPGAAPNWNALIYIGAQPGDSWKTADETLYKLSALEERNGVQVAVITKTSETVLNSERIGIRDEIVLQEGVGLVKRTQFASFDGKPNSHPSYITELESFNGSPVKSLNARADASGKDGESMIDGVASVDVTRSVDLLNGLPQSLHDEQFRGQQIIVTGCPVFGQHKGGAFQVSLALEVDGIRAWCRFRGEKATIADKEFGKFAQLAVRGRFVDVDESPSALILDDCEVITTYAVPTITEASKRAGDSFSEQSVLPKKRARTDSLAKGSYSRRALDSVQLPELTEVQFLKCEAHSRLDALQAVLILAVNFSGGEVRTSPESLLAKRIHELPQALVTFEKVGQMWLGIVVLPDDWESVFGSAPQIQQRTEFISGMSKPSSYASWRLECNDGSLTFTGDGILRTQPPRLDFSKVYHGEH